MLCMLGCLYLGGLCWLLLCLLRLLGCVWSCKGRAVRVAGAGCIAAILS